MNTEAEQTETEEEKLEREFKEKQRELVEIQLRNAKAEEAEHKLRKRKREKLIEERAGIPWLIGWGIVWFFIIGILVTLTGPFALIIAFFAVWWAIKRMTQGE